MQCDVEALQDIEKQIGYIFLMEVVQKSWALKIFLGYSADIMAIGIVAVTIVIIMAMTVTIMDIASHAAKIHLQIAILLLRRWNRRRVPNAPNQYKLDLNSALHVGRVKNWRHAKAAVRKCHPLLRFVQVVVQKLKV